MIEPCEGGSVRIGSQPSQTGCLAGLLVGILCTIDSECESHDSGHVTAKDASRIGTSAWLMYVESPTHLGSSLPRILLQRSTPTDIILH